VDQENSHLHFRHSGNNSTHLLFIYGQFSHACFIVQLAAKTAGIGPLDGGVIGYGPLVQQVLDIKLDKSQTMTDWRLRPLTKEQISYAANDVKYLFACTCVLEIIELFRYVHQILLFSSARQIDSAADCFESIIVVTSTHTAFV
jgi:ribonuclease D